MISLTPSPRPLGLDSSGTRSSRQGSDRYGNESRAAFSAVGCRSASTSTEARSVSDMSTAIVRVNSIFQNDDSLPIIVGRMLSKVVFDVETAGTTYRDCWCALSRPVGTGYMDEPFEVGPPRGYPDGLPWDADAFGDRIARFYTTREYAVSPSLVGDIVRRSDRDPPYTFSPEPPNRTGE